MAGLASRNQEAIAIQAEVSTLGLGASLVFIAIAMALSYSRQLRIEGSIAWSSARAMVQLLLVGAALVVVLDPARPMALAWLWVGVMVVFAAITVKRRVPEVPRIFWLALFAYVVAAMISIGILFGLRVFKLDARTLIPLAGMMVGNSMTATVVAARRVVEELREKRDEVEARLSLGQPSNVAARPYLVSALRTALIPQIETTKAVGVVFLPGAMTGMILAGVSPFVAVKVQIVVMYLVLGSVATTATVIGLGTVKLLFTRDHRLVRLVRPADS